MTRKSLHLVAISMLLTAVLASSFLNFSFVSPTDSPDHRLVVMREIGHRLLLQAGDSSSRVLPVKKMSERIYQVDFASSFSFSPDSLVTVVSHAMAKGGVTDAYYVNVVECDGDEPVYSYRMDLEKSIVPCLGRHQPEAWYFVQIVFDDRESSGIPGWLPAACLGGLISIGLILFKTKRSVSSDQQPIAVGAAKFFPNQRLIVIGDETTPLTSKEARLLELLVKTPNVVVERKQLTDEIWGKEGVIVGRSLDVFISRLRKKLGKDPTIRIAVVNGCGYKLELPEGK